MAVEWVAGNAVDLSVLAPHDPVLVAEGDPAFAKTMASAGHYTFYLNPDPCEQAWRYSGMSSIRKSISSRSRSCTMAIYAVKDGQSKQITPRESETYVDVHLEYVQAVDVVYFSKEVGVQEWGIIRLAKDCEEILSEWPGPLAKEISLATQEEWDSISAPTFAHLGQWYTSPAAGLLVRRDL